VAQNRFREDLFHRLNVIRIHIPELRERREDIPVLSEYFLKQSAMELNEDNKILKPETLSYLQSLPWQGNVRQLENFCRWITVMAAGVEVSIEDLPPELQQTTPQSSADSNWEKSLATWARNRMGAGTIEESGLLYEALPQFERIMILAALEQTGGRKRDASLLLGWGRNTLTRKMSELGLSN
jgi:two-component system nitrogen regulation response regulator GlnG